MDSRIGQWGSVPTAYQSTNRHGSGDDAHKQGGIGFVHAPPFIPKISESATDRYRAYKNDSRTSENGSRSIMKLSYGDGHCIKRASGLKQLKAGGQTDHSNESHMGSITMSWH